MKRASVIAPSLRGVEVVALLWSARGSLGLWRSTVRGASPPPGSLLSVASLLAVTMIVQPALVPSAGATATVISGSTASPSPLRGFGWLAGGDAGSLASGISGSYDGYDGRPLGPNGASGYNSFGGGSRDPITSEAFAVAVAPGSVLGSPLPAREVTTRTPSGKGSAFQVLARPFVVDNLGAPDAVVGSGVPATV